MKRISRSALNEVLENELNQRDTKGDTNGDTLKEIHTRKKIPTRKKTEGDIQ